MAYLATVIVLQCSVEFWNE